MQRKLTEQQQIFVTEYLKTGEVTGSARAAGYSGPETQGSRLLKNPFVRAEIEEARKAVVEEGSFTLKKALAEADAAYAVAEEKGNAAGMVAATTLKTKLTGMWVDKSEVFSAGFSINISGYDD